jgi:hypothetical protein
VNERFSYAKFVLKRVIVYEAIILAGIGLFCLIIGWRSVNEISIALLVAGVIIFSIGPFSTMGGWGNTRNWQYQYVQTMDQRNAVGRAQDNQADMRRNMGIMGPSLLLGTITMILSVVFQTMFR